MDLSSLVQNVVDLYEPLAEDECVTIHLNASAPMLIEADGKLLFEAMSNLVDNAIKFAAANVWVAVRRDSDATIVEVRDDGPGIPAEEREAVLRRFHRGAHAADVPGSGLGLSVVAAIMHLHGFALRFRWAWLRPHRSDPHRTLSSARHGCGKFNFTRLRRRKRRSGRSSMECPRRFGVGLLHRHRIRHTGTNMLQLVKLALSKPLYVL